jgi:hypothetical protein
VHNVPFKWCNADLESLFKEEPGYLDAQLLFHENGRSKVRVGGGDGFGPRAVGLSRSRRTVVQQRISLEERVGHLLLQLKVH